MMVDAVIRNIQNEDGLPLDSLSMLSSFKIQVEYLMLICYNKQWNEIPIFL